MVKLTPRQKAFVAEYLITPNAALAAEKAGYSPKNAEAQGRRLLAYSRVSAAIAEAQNQPGAPQNAAPASRSGQDVLTDIRAVTREAWGEGDIKTALRGLEMEGKLMGMFKGKAEDAAPPLPEPVLNIPDNGRE